jgi:hypothetical protein
MVLIERSVETPDLLAWLQGIWQGRPQGGLEGVPTLKRPQFIQYPGMPSKILTGASNEEVVNDETDEEMVEVVNDEDTNLLILTDWSVETSRYTAWLRGVWQSHPGMPTLRRSQNTSAQAPGSTWQGHRACTPQGGLHSRRKILDVQSRLAGLQERTDLGRSRI